MSPVRLAASSAACSVAQRSSSSAGGLAGCKPSENLLPARGTVFVGKVQPSPHPFAEVLCLCMALVVQLAGLDAQRQVVARRWQRAGGEGGESAGRAIGTIEVECDHGLLRQRGFEEPPGRVACIAGGLVAKDKEQLV